MKKHILFVISLLFTSTIFGQVNYFKIVGEDDGLSQGFVYSITSGPQGYLWLGTSDGFKKFNGNRIFSTLSSNIPQQTASASLLASDSTLWLGFFNGTIVKVVQGDSVIVYDDLFSEKLSAIVEAEYGAVFFIGQQGSIGRYYQGGFTIFPPASEGLFFYDAIHFSKSLFYIASESGLLSISFNQDLYSYKVEYDNAVLSLSKKGQQLFAGTRNSIITKEINGTNDFNTKAIEAPVIDLLVDDSESLWAATSGNGLWRFSDLPNLSIASRFNELQGLPSAYLVSLGLDREGHLWVGTGGNGLSMFLGEAFSYPYQEIAQKGINTLKSDQEHLWIGTDNGLYLLQNTEISTYLIDESITAFDISEDGSLWVGLEGKGLYVKQVESEEFTPIDIKEWPRINTINSIDISQNGHIWLATRLHGLLELHPDLVQFQQYNISDGLPHNNIFQALCDKNNRVWLATSGDGVGYIDNGSYYPLKPDNQLNQFEINCLLKTKDGSIWMGSNGGGLFKYSSDSIIQYTEKDGLLNPYINMLDEDSFGNLWIGSSSGVHIWDSSLTKKRNYSTNVTNWDSFVVRNNTSTIYRKYVFLKTDSGLLQYNEEMAPNTNVLPLVDLINAEIDGASVLHQDNIKLPYGDYRLKLEFEAMHFGMLHEVAYRYKLSGFENDWSEYSNRNFAEYPKLGPGNYELLIQAKTSDQLKSHITNEIKISIAIPFWQKLWFYILCVLILFFVGFSIHQYRLRRLKKVNKLLSFKVDEKTRELSEEKDKLKDAYEKLVQLEGFKESMNSMIVHDLKNPLNLVMTLSDEDSQVYEAGRQMLNMVLNILDVNRFEEAKVGLTLQSIKLAALLKHAFAQVNVVLHQKQIEVKSDFKEGLTVEVDADILTRVLVNLLTNAVKYSPAGSMITISAQKKNKKVYISVADTGYGISSKELPYIFDKFRQAENHEEVTMRSTGLGLTFCKLAIEAHGGEITVESEEGKGSTFTFSVQGEEILDNVSLPIQKENKGLLELTKADRELLSQFLQEFEKLEVYDTSKNLELISEIPESSKELKIWKESLEKAVIAFNESQYHSLLEQVVRTKEI